MFYIFLFEKSACIYFFISTSVELPIYTLGFTGAFQQQQNLFSNMHDDDGKQVIIPILLYT